MHLEPAAAAQALTDSPGPGADVFVPGALWRRLAARLLDMFTVFFIVFALVVGVLFAVMDRLSTALDIEPWGRPLAATILYAVVGTVYEVAFLSLRGQTPGKDVMKLRVLSEATGDIPTVRVALVRATPMALLRLVPGVGVGTAAVAGVGATIAFGHRRRALHDFLAGTVVVSYDADAEDVDEDPALERRVDRVADRESLVRTYGARSWLDAALRRRRR